MVETTQNRGREGGEGARETRERKKGKRERVIRSHNWNSLGFKKLISLDPAGFTVSLEIRLSVSFGSVLALFSGRLSVCGDKDGRQQL